MAGGSQCACGTGFAPYTQSISRYVDLLIGLPETMRPRLRIGYKKTRSRDMTDLPLLSRCADGVLVLTLNRPERRNALSPELYELLLQALEEGSARDDVGAIVLTGAGGAFCAGGDVARMAGDSQPPSFEARVARLRRRARISELLHTSPKPTLAMMRGPAVGAGLSLALACDMRLGDESARLRTGFLQVGVAGDFGGHYFLPRLVGMARARELYLTSRMIEAGEALAMGLLNQLHPAAGLEDAAMAIAAGWANGPRTAIAYMKQNLNQGLDGTLAEVLDGETWRHARCVETADHKEAALAYMEKRPPRYSRGE
jgi:2-(1,2-epoxy-1,2-dihydrophenyl)acetyl-CoA isomerase